MAQPKDHKPPPDWLTPFAPGKQFIIPDTIEQYKSTPCRDPFHIFLNVATNCKCGAYFWPATDQYTRSRPIRIPRND
jgi:hypothetical protein